jgi:rhomboid protease GlpG
MRQLGTLPDAPSARILADYLLSQSIDTRLEQSAGGWTVWVCDEDKLERAREEFQTFLRDPAAERFQGATKEAQKRRAEQSRKDAEWARRQKAVTRPELPRRRLTILLIAASVVVTVIDRPTQEREFVDKYLYITEVHTIEASGKERRVLWFKGLSELKHGQLWRLITPIFIHFDAWHLLFNLLWLVALGGVLEPRYGTWRFGLLVVLIAAVSNLCQYLFSTVALVDGKLVTESRPLFGGLSGVVFGLFGFMWIKAVYEPGCGLYVTPGSVMLMMAWLLLCMTGLVGPIANTAHLVGLAAGMLTGYASAWWNGFGQPPPEASDN